MHIIQPARRTYRVIAKDRTATEFDTLSKVASFLVERLGSSTWSWRDKVVTHFWYSYRTVWPDARPPEFSGLYIVRDDLGDVVDPEDVIDLVRERKRRYPWSGMPKRGRFRDGPWPGTRCRRGWAGYSRRLAHHNMLAWNEADDQDLTEIGVHPLKTRRVRRILTNWDEVGRGLSRSWKDHRDAQAKGRSR